MIRTGSRTGLYRLVYVSRHQLSGDMTEIAADMGAILAVSERHNARAGVTGALFVTSGIFAQVLEGARSDVAATFERIEGDPRHTAVQLLTFEPALERSFPSWSMTCVGHSLGGRDLLGPIGDETGFEAQRLEAERILTIMQAIARDEEQAQAA